MIKRLTFVVLVLVASLSFVASAGATTCANREAPAGKTDSTLVETAVLCETNNRRAAAGLAPLPVNAQLTAAARSHASDMVARGYFSHSSPEGTSPTDRAGAQGYFASGCCGENIFMGPDHAQEAVQGWMDSSGHRANVLNADYQEIGVGVVGTMYVQVFSQGLLAPGATGLEPEHQGSAGRDPALQVSLRGRDLNARTPSTAPLSFTATNVHSGDARTFGHGGDGIERLPLPGGTWRLCWTLVPDDPYGGASSCLASAVTVFGRSGVRVTGLGGRQVDLFGVRATGRPARIAVQRRERRCQAVGRWSLVCSTRWRTIRRFSMLLRETQRLSLGRGLSRDAKARVVVSVAAFEANGVPYRATRVVKRLR